MIAFLDGLPCLDFGDGRVIAFDRGWLASNLRDAAHRAGYANWWLADHVADSVTSYLRLHFKGSVVTVSRLAGAVESALEVIGYAEVARCFAPGPPPVRISLDELANDAGTGYELAFFNLLADRIDGAVRERITQLQLFGLEQCVKRLRAKKCWGRDCDALRSEIVGFVRGRLETARFEKPITFALT